MNKADKPIRVIVADDHTLVRAGICALLEKMPGVVVVGEADDGREAQNLVKQQRPHVVLMDISMTGLNGLEATIRIWKDFPEIRVLILSMHNNEDYWLACIESRCCWLSAQESGDCRIGNGFAPGSERRSLP